MDHKEAERSGHAVGHIITALHEHSGSSLEYRELISIWRDKCCCCDGTDGSRSGIKELKILKEFKIDSRIFTHGHHPNTEHRASDCELCNVETPRLVEFLQASIEMVTMVRDFRTSTEDVDSFLATLSECRAERFHRLRQVWFTEP